MNALIEYLSVVLITFFVCFALCFPTVYFAKKLKAGQTVLHYVDKHEGKSGTPTMGGVGFLLAVSIVTLIFCNEKMAVVALCVSLGYGLVGFLDDFIKIKLKRNLGLKAYQKIIGQAGIAIFVTAFCYLSTDIGSKMFIPFVDTPIDIGFWFIPFCFIVCIAVTNSVNLTDGLDGLVAHTSCVYFLVFGIIIAIMSYQSAYDGLTFYANQLSSLSSFCFIYFGAMLAFSLFNSNPAKIFMGDTGSLAIGGACTCVALFSQNAIFIPLVGIMYVVSCISVILQVLYFKRTKKRIFLMAPYHHHLEYKGLKECKIVSLYTVVTIIAGCIAILMFLL